MAQHEFTSLSDVRGKASLKDMTRPAASPRDARRPVLAIGRLFSQARSC
jgi:hypothetical protein